MNPDVDQILKTSASQLMGILAPLLPEGYAQGQASLLGFMMLMCSQEYGRAAEIRVAENADMRALFAALAPGVDDVELRDKLHAAAQSHDESVAISALNKTNADLRRLLILLQSHVEAQTDSRSVHDARVRIWGVLKRSSSRRLVKLA